MDKYKPFVDKRIDFIILFFFSVLIIFSRIPFMAKFLFNLDSVNFALSFGNFNILMSQPHPPGYIFFVSLGKIVNLIFNDPNTTMIAINILFTILTVIVIYFLVKQMFKRKLAFIVSVLLIFNPVFWFYGDIAAIYMSEAFLASLIAYTSYQVLKGNNKFLYISALVLGLSGGFKPELVVFMFPLWLYCINHKRSEYQRILMALIILVVSILLWYIPTIFLTGYESYSLLSKTQFINSFSVNSVLFGADISRNIVMASNLLGWSLFAMGAGTFILILFVFYKFKTIFKPSFFKKSKVIFLLLWVLPAFFFYLLVFIGKPGYILVYLPVFSIILGYVILNISIDLSKRFNSTAKDYYLLLILSLCIISGVLQFTSSSPGGVDYGSIYKEDQGFQYINQSLAEFSPENTLIIVDDQGNYRKIMYYFLDREIYCYFSYFSNGNLNKGLLYHNNGKSYQSESKNLEINMNSSTSKILWLVDYDSEFFKKIQSKIDTKTVILPNGQKVYYSDVNGKTYFEIYGFVFKRE